jgi:tyrosine-protein kinase Etk/Wzc
MSSSKPMTNGSLHHADAVSISEYLRVLVENRRLIVLVALAVFAAGASYAALQSPMYRSDALIQIGPVATSSSEADALGKLATLFDSRSKAGADTEIELIRSRLVVGDAVQKLHLDITAQPRYFPVIGRWIARLRSGDGDSAPLFGFGQFAWGGEQIEASRFAVPEGLTGRAFIVKARSGNSYELIGPGGNVLGSGKVGQPLNVAGDGGQISLLVSKLHARPGCEFTLTANSLQSTILGLQAALAITEKKAQTGMIGVALDGHDRVQVAAIVNAIAEQYEAQDLARRSSEAEHSLLFLEGQLPALREELQHAEDKYNAFRNSKGTVDLSTESRLLLQQVVELDTALRGLMQQRDDLAQRYRSNYPLVTALDAKIARSEEDRAAVSRRIATLPDTEQTALRLMRDVRVDTELYTNLLNSAQQLRVIRAGNIGNVRVVDRAMPPEKPFKPNWRVVLAMSALLGLLLGVVAAFLKKTLAGGVERSSDIERAVGVPVFAVVPHSDRQTRLEGDMRRKIAGPHVLAARSPYDVAVEGVRSLRTALLSASPMPSNNVVLITSARPGVGKSFLAANLAAVLAAGSKRVLLIDADMRMGTMHARFSPEGGPGLCELLHGAEFDEVVVRDAMDGVDFIPCGDQSPNPADVLMSQRMSDILQTASARYDAVVIDTPPVLAVTDATLIGRHAGTTMLVVRHGRHPVSEVSEALDRLRSGGVSVRGILFTDVPAAKHTYGSRYDNGGRYGDGRDGRISADPKLPAN